MLDAGFARILLPTRIGGYGLGFDTWFEVTRELSKADASHGWCAGLIIHHAHLIGAVSRKRRRRRCGPTASMCRSRRRLRRTRRPCRVDGGYRVSGKGSPFASGVDHCSWVMLGGMAHDGAAPEWKFFLVAAGRLHGARHLVHRRHAGDRQQDHRHRQRLRAARRSCCACRPARRQDARAARSTTASSSTRRFSITRRSRS